MTGLQAVSRAIADDMARRLPRQRKTQREKLATLTAALLSERTVNLMELGHALPIQSANPNTRYQWVRRTLANRLIDPAEVLAPYAREVLEKVSRNGRQPVLIIDQSQATKLHRHEMLMVAVRVGGRALPLAWCVRKTAGAIGFSEQRRLLQIVAGWLPDGVRPVLMGDRFYGSPDLITWCADNGWDWRLRLKGGLLVHDRDGGETTVMESFERGERRLIDVTLTEKRAATHVAMIHEPGHPEPWMIAMSQPPTSYRALDYGLRWGIEAMFSDTKTRGFNLEDSQLRRADRIERLILVLALALYWAVSTGMWDAANNPSAAEKKPPNTARVDTPAPCSPSSSEVSAAS